MLGCCLSRKRAGIKEQFPKSWNHWHSRPVRFLLPATKCRICWVKIFVWFDFPECLFHEKKSVGDFGALQVWTLRKKFQLFSFFGCRAWSFRRDNFNRRRYSCKKVNRFDTAKLKLGGKILAGSFEKTVWVSKTILRNEVVASLVKTLSVAKIEMQKFLCWLSVHVITINDRKVDGWRS